MHEHVVLKNIGCCEGIVTLLADKRSFVSVSPLVLQPSAVVRKAAGTVSALEGLFPGMLANVTLKFRRRAEAILTES